MSGWCYHIKISKYWKPREGFQSNTFGCSWHSMSCFFFFCLLKLPTRSSFSSFYLKPIICYFCQCFWMMEKLCAFSFLVLFFLLFMLCTVYTFFRFAFLLSEWLDFFLGYWRIIVMSTSLHSYTNIFFLLMMNSAIIGLRYIVWKHTS